MLHGVNSTLHSIDQNLFQHLLSLATPGVKFADVLAAQGLRAEISSMKIHSETQQIIDFSDCTFSDVTFSGNFQQSRFDNAHFNNAVFHDANIEFASFQQAHFNKSTFFHSDFSHAYFSKSEIKNTQIWDCDLSNTTFVQSDIEHSILAKVKLDNVHEYRNHIHDMHIVFNQAYDPDSTFTQANHHPIKPTVVLVGDQEWHDTPFEIVQKYAGTPVTISEDAPRFVNRLLSDEVHQITDVTKILRQFGIDVGSIPQKVLHSDQPIINDIYNYAKQMVENADAIWIPGGPDIHPEFYGETNTNSYPREDYYREILEFSLVDAALAMNKPILGVCHGSQLVNVYFGGTLHQHVYGQSGISPLLQQITDKGILGSVIDGPIHGPSYHHQAVKDVAYPLEVVLTYNGVVKATQATDGSKIILCQFHPEHEADGNSVNILNQFMNLSAESKMQTKAIELSKVLHLEDTIDHLLDNALNKLEHFESSPTIHNGMDMDIAMHATPLMVAPLEPVHHVVLA